MKANRLVPEIARKAWVGSACGKSSVSLIDGSIPPLWITTNTFNIHWSSPRRTGYTSNHSAPRAFQCQTYSLVTVEPRKSSKSAPAAWEDQSKLVVIYLVRKCTRRHGGQGLKNHVTAGVRKCLNGGGTKICKLSMLCADWVSGPGLITIIDRSCTRNGFDWRVISVVRCGGLVLTAVSGKVAIGGPRVSEKFLSWSKWVSARLPRLPPK